MSIKALSVVVFAAALPGLPVVAGTSGTTKLTAEEASQIALELQPGTIAEAELDQFEGRAVFDIEVVNAAGEEIEFKIDVETGEVLNQWTDNDPTDDPMSGAVEETDS